MACLAVATGVLILAFASSSQGANLNASSDKVAVLDLIHEKAPEGGDRDWIVGLADTFELALQEENVATLERRQIRLLLGERELLGQGVISADTLRAARLPSATWFVGGQVQRGASNEFVITVSLVHPGSATVETSFTRRGSYPVEWSSTIFAIAHDVASYLRSVTVPAPRHAGESMTWLPEATLPFFKGLECYARGDYAGAIVQFNKARTEIQPFDLARLWEARAYQHAGFPELAEFAIRPLKIRQPAVINPPAKPVVVVLGGRGITSTGRAAFIRELARSGRFTVFEPTWIGATLREVDLQLTGQMAAPLNENSGWLVIDDVVFLDSISVEGNSSACLRARELRLLSAGLVRQAMLQGLEKNKDVQYVRLAQQFIRARSKKNSESVIENNSTIDSSAMPSPSDPFEISFAKALRLVQQHPTNPRYLIGLSDYYSTEWLPKAWLLDRAIEQIGHDRTQPDAAFLLTSALWRKRNASRRPWWTPDAPLKEDFALLNKWFPNSPEIMTLAEVTEKAGSYYTHSAPQDARYLGNLYWTGNPQSPLGSCLASHQTSAALLSDKEKLERLRLHRKSGANAKAWPLAVSLRLSKDPAIGAEAQQIYMDLLGVLIQEYRQYRSFTMASQQDAAQAVWTRGQLLLNCIDRYQRGSVIKLCSRLARETRGAEAQFRFVWEQVERYKDDFDIDPALGITKTELLNGDGGQGQATISWSIGSPIIDYCVLMGELAEEMQQQLRPDLAGKVFDRLYHEEDIPVANRLTAAYDLAEVCYETGRYFEALDLLEKVITDTQGTTTPKARKNGVSGTLEEAAFTLLKKVRLYADSQMDFCHCCGKPSDDPPMKPANFESVEKLFGELQGRYQLRQGADNSSVQNALLEKKDEVLPFILYQLRRGEMMNGYTLIFCGLLGTNAAPAVPYLVPWVCHTSFESINAASALSQIGKSSGCSVPALIVAAEEFRADRPTFAKNASFALKQVSPAPRESVPYLARLLYHANPAVAGRAARAIAESAPLGGHEWEGKPQPELVSLVKRWWEQQGAKQNWNATARSQ